jgi:hypothetical protein
MTKKRGDFLCDLATKFKHDLIVHEMGVPPIHTPADALASLSEEIKQKMIVVHVSKDKIPAGSGLNSAREGLENTYVLYPHDYSIPN